MNLSYFTTTFCSALLLTACVATDPDSLGELSSGGDDPMMESAGSDTGGSDAGGSDTGGSVSATSTSGEGSGSASDTGPAPACPGPTDHYEPASCPNGLVPQLPVEGCYVACDGPGAPCDAGICTEVDTNPCPCDEDDEVCCGACAASAWLCIEGAAEDPCAEVIGTTFWSVDEMECGLGPMGPVLCNWSVQLELDGEFIWMYSDVGEGGNYSCVGGEVTVTNGPMVEVSYDPVTDTLTWDGIDYLPAL